MQGTYNYEPGKPNVSRVYNFAGVVYQQFVQHEIIYYYYYFYLLSKCILKYREEERRQNRNVPVANMFFENVANL